MALLLAGAHATVAQPVGTAFTYQGRLNDAGLPANGLYDFDFQLFRDATGGAPLLKPLRFTNISVSGGLFTVTLDFGVAFTGGARWLEIGVRPGGTFGAFTPLTPRQELTPTPNAVFASSAATVAAGGISTAQLADGAVTSPKLASGQVVKSLNSLNDAVTIAGGGGATVSTAGNTLTVVAAAPPAPGSVVVGIVGDTTLIGAGYAPLAQIQEVWSATNTDGAPGGRFVHTAVWTGTRMIVWGGVDLFGFINTGGQYDPATNSWTATSTASAPSARRDHTAVWTGSEMAVWGGYDSWGPNTVTNTGGLYNPVANTWTAISTVSAPIARTYHTAVWNGSAMIVWGGWDGTTACDTGGLYDPVANTWTATSTVSVPNGRYWHTAVWTGSKMIVWGGAEQFVRSNTGGQYDPLANSWTATAITAGVPSARSGHSAVWTGSRMIVWCGTDNGQTNLNTGGQYDPLANSWTPTSLAGVPSGRQATTAVWTGSRMLVWGGLAYVNFSPTSVNTGGQYDPLSDSWTAIATPGVPSARQAHTAVWTGSRMVVWGGYDGTASNTGGQWFVLSYFLKN